MKKSLVSIVKASKQPSEKEIDVSVRKAIELAGGLTDIISRGDTVLIKPNLVRASHPDTGTTTDPRICKSIANMVKEIGAKPIVAESSAIGLDTEEAFKVAGYGQLRSDGFEIIDLKKEKLVKVLVPKGKLLKKVYLPKVVVDANVIISVPSMKTHSQTAVTLSLKNMKGVLPDAFKKKFHLIVGLFQGIADLNTLVRPALSVVDGIVAQEGLGPVSGIPVDMGLIVAGKDPVAVDTITTVIMGFTPQKGGVTDISADAGIGTAKLEEIEVVGEPISKVERRFKRAEEDVYDLITIPEGFQLLIDEKTCTGCRNGVLSSLVEMKNQGQLDMASGWTIVTGKIDTFPKGIDREHLLLVGNCTRKFKGQGIFVQGCTPHNTDVVSALLESESAFHHEPHEGSTKK